MSAFQGFTAGSVRHLRLPVTFFSDLLPLIDDLAELQVTLFCFYALYQKEGEYRYLCRRDFDFNAVPWLAEALRAARPQHPPEETLVAALAQAVTRGTLLRASVALRGGAEDLYFFNTPAGRAAIEQIGAGRYQLGDAHRPVELLPERPNIFALYEANIGPLTPIIADELRDAAVEYPALWLEEAVRLAVEHNKRSWRYIRAILERWHREGKDKGKDRGTAGKRDQTDGKRYITGQYAAFIKYRADE